MQMRTFLNITQIMRSHVLRVLYGNEYGVGLFTLKFVAVHAQSSLVIVKLFGCSRPGGTIVKSLVQLTTTITHRHSDELLSFRLFSICAL